MYLGKLWRIDNSSKEDMCVFYNFKIRSSLPWAPESGSGFEAKNSNFKLSMRSKIRNRSCRQERPVIWSALVVINRRMSMNKGKLVSALVALTLGMFVGSAYSADRDTAPVTDKPAKSAKKKTIKSHDPAASEVQGRRDHPATPDSGSTVKSHDPAASEVIGRSTHPDASQGSDLKAGGADQQHDRAGHKKN